MLIELVCGCDAMIDFIGDWRVTIWQQKLIIYLEDEKKTKDEIRIILYCNVQWETENRERDEE